MRAPVSYTHLDVYKRQAEKHATEQHERQAHRCARAPRLRGEIEKAGAGTSGGAGQCGDACTAPIGGAAGERPGEDRDHRLQADDKTDGNGVEAEVIVHLERDGGERNAHRKIAEEDQQRVGQDLRNDARLGRGRRRGSGYQAHDVFSFEAPCARLRPNASSAMIEKYSCVQRTH